MRYSLGQDILNNMFLFFLIIIAELQELPPVCVASLMDVLYLEDDSPNSEEKDDLLRDLVTKISSWLDTAGITRRSGADNFKIVEESETERSERNVT